MGYDAEVLADSPVAYWKLNESGSTNIADTTGLGHSGVPNGTPPSGVRLGGEPQVDQSSIDFNGSSHYYTVTSATDISFTGSCAFELWLKTDTITSLHDAITKSVFGASGTGYAVYLNSANLNLGFYRAGSTSTTCTATTTTAIGTPYHVVFSYDSSTTTVTPYVDGVVGTPVGAFAVPGGNTQDLALGAWLQGGVSEYWDGLLDCVALYPSTLSATRVAAHYNAASPAPKYTNKGTSVASAATVVNPTTFSPGIPTGMAAGDTMLLFTESISNSATVATPTGWNLFPGYPVASGTASGGKQYVFWKPWVSGDSAPSISWTGVVTGTSGDSSMAIILAIRGAELDTPNDGSTVTGTDTAITTTATIGSTTTTYNSSLVVSFTLKVNDTAHTWTPSTGWIERDDTHTTTGIGHSRHIQDKLIAAGASGSTTIAPSTTVSSRALSTTIAIPFNKPHPRQAASQPAILRASNY